METPTDGPQGVGEAVSRAKRFLGLGALLTVVVAGVAVLLTVRHYAERQFLAVAVMRAVGATRRRLTLLFVGRLLWLGLFAGAAGGLLGYLVHWGMLAFVADLIDRDVPPAGWRPLAVGWLTALAALFGFALPTLLRLRDAPPMRVLRREAGEGILRSGIPVAVAGVVVCGLMAWQAGEWRLAADATLPSRWRWLAAAAGLSIVAVRALARRRGGRLLWLSGFTRRPWTAVVQIVGVGSGLMALFLLAVVRNDLLDAWQDRIPPDADQFLINIQPDELPGVRERLAEHGIDAGFSPMVRRMVAQNGEPVASARPPTMPARAPRSPRVRPDLGQELRPATGAGRRPVVGGRSTGRALCGGGFRRPSRHRPGGYPHLRHRRSACRGRGDQNLREVAWKSFQVNFFVVASPGTLEDLPRTWLTSFHAPEGADDLIGIHVLGLPQRHRYRRHHHPAHGAGHHGSGQPCGGVDVVAHPRRGGASAAGGAADHR
ncbi:MAG: FtsX-like permease family protein [Arhodomonas sp.]|nr:FtsX-like permease family protein [Arhodomonas sp.]